MALKGEDHPPGYPQKRWISPSTPLAETQKALINQSVTLNPEVVPRAGLEPASHTAADFKSAVFTNFTTGAR